MADIISRLKLESGEFDSKIKRAGQELLAYSEHCKKTGLEMGYANRDAKEFAKALGSMQTTATTARGKVSELSDAFVNLKTMYNQMTDAEKQGQFGKNLAASLDMLKHRTQQAKQELSDITKELQGGSIGGNTGGLFGGGKLDGMLQVFGGNLMTKGFELATSAVTNFASEIGGCIQQGIEMARQGEGIRNAFARLGRGDILDGLRKATHGTVTDLELMKAAVKFNDFRLPVEELGTMLAFAQQKAKDTGQSVDYMVDSIVTGLGRKSLMILDNLGLSASEIREKMKETGDMTKAVGAIIREQMSKAGDYVETAADRAAQANVSLQNKMEELGRKFAPVEEASNQLWTSMKIGILDIIGGPLATLLNQLTEAGRLRNQLNNLNGGGNGQPSQVEKQLGKLRVSKAAGSDYMTRTLYSGQVEEYNRKINAINEYLKQYDKKHDTNVVLPAASRQFGQKFDSINQLKTFRDAYVSMKDEYIKGAQEIIKPVKVKIDTNEASQDIESLKVKLAELQAQRKKAIEAGDTDKSKQLLQQINQVKADIKGLAPNALKTGGTNPAKQAADKVAAAQHDYAQAIEKATLEFDAGRATEADVKRKTYDAQMQLWQAYGKAYDTYADPKYKQAQDECAEKIKQLGGEVTASAEAQKKQQDAARQLEQAQKRVAEAMAEAQTAYVSNDLKGYMAAQKKVGGDVNQGIATGAFTFTGSNLEAFTAKLKEDLSKADLGSELYNQLTAQLADATTLGNVMQVAIKNGIDTAQFDPQDLWKKIFGENPGDYIDPKTWQSVMDGLNKELKGKGKKATLDNNTGSVREGRGKPGDRLEKFNNDFSKVTGGIGNIASGIQSLGIELPQELQSVLGVLNGISSIMTGVLALLTLIQIDTKATAGASIIDAIVPLARGGIVPQMATGGIVPHMATGGVIPRAAFGRVIPGNSFSGDNIFAGGAMVNSGELVLNKAQQGNLASTLRGGFSNMRFELVARGEQLRLVMNNNGKRTGKGELATWK